MGIDNTCGGEKSRIGNAPNSSFAVVAGDVVQQPFDGVVGVGAFVDLSRRFLSIFMWCHFLEGAFGHIAATNILVDEDEAIALEHRRGAETSGVLIGAVGTNAVRCTDDEEGVSLGRVFGHINRREKLHAIAHRDTIFVLCVVWADFRFARRFRAGLRERPACGQGRQGAEQQNRTRHNGPKPVHANVHGTLHKFLDFFDRGNDTFLGRGVSTKGRTKGFCGATGRQGMRYFSFDDLAETFPVESLSLRTRTRPSEWNEPPVAVLASLRASAGRTWVTSETKPVEMRVFST